MTDVSVSFAGCGFLGLYHVGVARCIQEHSPSLFSGRFLGSSVGGLIAASIILGYPPDNVAALLLEVSSKARSRFLGPFNPSFNLSRLLRGTIMKLFPPDAYKICSNRLHLSLTRVSDGSNVIVSEFDSNKELMDALLCSCHIPFFSGLVPPKFRGVFYVDGFLSNNLLSLDKGTITVSPFSGSVDICPKDSCEIPFDFFMGNTPMQFSLFNVSRLVNVVYPPSDSAFRDLARQGYHDAFRFLSLPSPGPHFELSCQCCSHAYFEPKHPTNSLFFRSLFVMVSAVLLPLDLLLAILLRFVAYFPELFVDLRIVVKFIGRRSARRLKGSLSKRRTDIRIYLKPGRLFLKL